jgi:hypothetical protein
MALLADALMEAEVEQVCGVAGAGHRAQPLPAADAADAGRRGRARDPEAAPRFLLISGNKDRRAAPGKERGHACASGAKEPHEKRRGSSRCI